MSKQEVYDLLYEVMETLPSELILLIREYMFFLPLTEEIRYFRNHFMSLPRIVPLSTNRIILHCLHELFLIEDDEIKITFQFNDITEISALSRYDNNSFVIAHDNIIDKITLLPNITKTKIINIDNSLEIQHMHTDKDGYILMSGWDGIFIIAHGKIIQHLFEGENCVFLHNDNTLELCSPCKFDVPYRLFKINGLYQYKSLNKISPYILSNTESFGVRVTGNRLSIQSTILYPIEIDIFLPLGIADMVILQDKIYVLTHKSVHVFHEKLITDWDILKTYL